MPNESEPRELEELSSERLDFLFSNDFASFCSLWGSFDLVIDKGATDEEFFDDIDIGLIRNASEYVQYAAEHYGYRLPPEFNEQMTERIEAINGVIKDVKRAIVDRTSSREVYETLLRLESEADIDLTGSHIPFFEE